MVLVIIIIICCYHRLVVIISKCGNIGWCRRNIVVIIVIIVRMMIHLLATLFVSYSYSIIILYCTILFLSTLDLLSLVVRLMNDR